MPNVKLYSPFTASRSAMVSDTPTTWAPHKSSTITAKRLNCLTLGQWNCRDSVAVLPGTD